jgi:hypothetical protein
MVAILKTAVLLLMVSWHGPTGLSTPITITDSILLSKPPVAHNPFNQEQTSTKYSSTYGRLCETEDSIIVRVAPDMRSGHILRRPVIASHSGICSCGKAASLGVPDKDGTLWDRVLCRKCGKAERLKSKSETFSLARRCRVCTRHALYALPVPEDQASRMVGKRRPRKWCVRVCMRACA